MNWAIPDGNGGTRPPLYREVVILDHKNEFVMGFDLASKPIDGASHSAQRAVVREALRTAAALADTDDDDLPDTWELDEFGSLAAVAADTPTGSGLPALLAYGLGQSPHAALDSMGLQLSRSGSEVVLSYTRRLASQPNLLWNIKRSQDLTTWLDWLDLTGVTYVTQYDGSGTERVSHRLPIGTPLIDAFRVTVTVGE
ncbi:MAG: hypothetical protein ACKV19_15300 [Verrucomicrobiales bacterium]